MRTMRTIAILLIIFITSCSQEAPNQSVSRQARLLDSLNVPESIQALDSLILVSPDAQPLNRISFSDSAVVGEQYLTMRPPPPFAGGPKIAIDSNNRVYMVNQTENTVDVFGPEGMKVGTIGREGRGPGEFSAIGGIDILDNRLLVNDASTLRIQIFSIPSGELQNITKLKSQTAKEEIRFGRPNTVFLHSDSTFLAAYVLNEHNNRSYTGLYILDAETEFTTDAIVKLIRQKNHQFTLPNGMVGGVRLPFSDKGIWAKDNNGNIYYANTQQFLIKVFGPDGSYRKAYYHPFENDPLEEQEVLNEFHESLHSEVQKADFPDQWPALESLLVDEKSRIWVSTIMDDKEVYEWWVLSPSGKLLAKFTWPREEPVAAIKYDKLYTSVSDRETGIKRVIRYDIEMVEE